MMKRRAATGLWSLADDGAPVRDAAWDVGPAIVAVPSEAVLVLAVDLPVARRQRLAALPFAIEDRIADPLDAVHVALGDEIAPRAVLAGIVRTALMDRWTAAVDAAGLRDARLVPDALLLPLPPAGSWSVAAEGGRVRVRTDDGGGFAVPEARFLTAWTLGGELLCRVHGAPLSFAVPGATTGHAAPPGIPPVALDLRQGRFAVPVRPDAALQRMGMVLAAGLCAHTAIAAVDTVKLRALADRRDAAVASEPQRGAFLPALAQTATKLAAVDGLGVTRLSFDGRTLTIAVERGTAAAARRALGGTATVVETAA